MAVDRGRQLGAGCRCWPAPAAIRRHRAPLAAFLAHVALVFGAAALGVAAFSAAPPARALDYLPPPLDGPARYLIEPLANWDGQWYTMIARHGYWATDPVPDPAAAAFWPLYPLLLHLGVVLTGWHAAIVGVLLSNAAFLGALLLLHRLVRFDYGASVADRAVWALALCPTAFFFSAVYTESLFLLLTLGAVSCGRTERWGRAATLGYLAALTRSTGVLVLLPLVGLLVTRHGPDPRRWWRRALPLAFIPLAPALFLGYQWWVSGDPLLTFHVQRKFGRAPLPPWEAVVAGLHQLDPLWFRDTACLATHGGIGPEACVAELRRQVLPYNETIMLAVFLLLPIVLRRLPPGHSLYVLAGLAVPLSNPWGGYPLVTLPRFAMVLFPLFIALALVLRRRWLFGVVLAFSALALVGLTIQFSTWFPVL